MIAYAITTDYNKTYLPYHDIDIIVYRDKETTTYEKNAKIFLNHTQNIERRLLHTDYKLAVRLKADGVHLNSKQFAYIQEAKALGLFVIISTHSEKEALEAQRLGADMVTFSPIFPTPNKGEPKGVKRVEELVKSLDIPLIALGGIVSQKEVLACKEAGAKGFASIRYFL
jgi:thiamine-phosphate pyrophosphorylase